MPLSDLTQTVNPSAGAGIPSPIDGIPLFIGYASGGTGETVYSFSDSKTLISTLVGGPVVEAAARALPGQCYVVPVVSDVVGVIGAVVKAGSGTPEMTVTGTATDNLTYTAKIVLGGVIGTSTFQLSSDGGNSYGMALPTAATYLIPGTAITIAMPAGTYVAGDTYSFPTTAPGYTATKLASAFAAFLASAYSSAAEFVHFVGSAADMAGTVTLATAIQTALANAFAQQCYMSAVIECPDVADATVAAGLTTVDAYLVSPTGGYADQISSVSQKVQKRPIAYAISRRAAKVQPQRHLGAVADGGLDGITKLYHDERTSYLFTTARITSLRTRPPRAGFYVEDCMTLASDTTSPLSNWYNVRVLLKAMRIAGAKLQNYVNGDWPVQANGTLTDAIADAIEQDVQSALEIGLYPKSNCSSVVFKLNRSDVVVTTQSFRSTVAVQIKAYSKWIANEVSAVRTINVT